MTPKLADLRKQRAAAFDAFKVLAEQPTLSEAEQVDYTDKEAAVRAFDEQIARAKAAQDLAGAAADKFSVTVTDGTDTITSSNATCSMKGGSLFSA